MNNINWVQIIIDVLMVIFGFLSIYIKTKTDIYEQVSGKIAEAEDLYKDYTKSGNLKFQWVVETLYSYIPAIMKPFITKEFIGGIVQKAFDSIEKYAEAQLDKLLSKEKKE